MSRRLNHVPGRHGWHLGEPITTALETRVALSHVEGYEPQWVYGSTPEERIEAAQRAIDEVYQRRWDWLTNLIVEGDRHGPNVRVLVESRNASQSDA